jgi:DNA-binding response OmpR family regulator
VELSPVFKSSEPRYRILLVDDEKILRILRFKLKASGYEVITATNGQDAITLVESEKPDIVVMDVIIPGMSGLEALQALRTFSDLPVIVISARTDNASKALSLGANSFLSKPFNPDELVKRIQAILDYKR